MRYYFTVILLSLFSIFLFAQNNQVPRCALDLLNEQRAEQDEDFRRELDYYLEVIVPRLSETEGDFRSADEIITIPVVVHVIHSGEAIGVGSNISEAQILDQLAVLNEDYTALNPNFDDTPARWQAIIGNPEIEFCLAQVDPTGAATDGITRDNIPITGTGYHDNNIDTDIKEATNWDPNHYYNIYVVAIPGTDESGGVLGWAFYPHPGTVGQTVDGAVVDYRWFGGPNSNVSGYKTLTHESGHYLGLPHPFDGDSCSEDDGIADTPNASEPTQDLDFFSCANGFPTGPTSCTEEHMYVNYMDYSHSSCYTSFSHGQINVMRGVLDGTTSGWGYASREDLVAYSSIACNVTSYDAGIVDILTPDGTTCGAEIFPVVVLKNFGSSTLTSVQIEYAINGGATTTYYWSGALGQGETEEVTLDGFFPPAGQFTFWVYTFNPNNSDDGNPDNDDSSTTATAIIPASLPLSETFEQDMFNPTASGMITNDLSGDGYRWERTTAVSGYGRGQACALFDNFAGNGSGYPAGALDVLYSRIYDFSSVTNAALVFDVAYALFDDLHSDTLFIMISTDCANTFNQAVYVKGGADLATAPNHGTEFTPNSAQWRTENIDLSAFDGEDNVLLAFVNKTGWGNKLYLDNIIIREPCELSISVSEQDATCYDNCNGQASVAVTNAYGDVFYDWQIDSDTQTTETVSNLCAGTYQVTVTDQLGCTETESFTIAEPDETIVDLTITQEISCNGGSDGSVSSAITGGTAPYTYQWSNGQNGATLTGAAVGTYSLTVTDAAQCTAEASITLNEPAAMSVDLTIVQEISCNGGSDGSVSSAITGGTAPYTYQWSNGQNGATLTGAAVGTYSLTVTDAAQCTAEASITLNEPVAMSVDLTIVQEISCNGGSNGSVSSAITGGTAPYTYQWNNGQNGATLTGVAVGTYTLTVTDAAQCTAEASITLNEPVAMSVDLTITQGILCNGGNTGSVSSLITGGTAPYTYQWSNGQNGAELTDVGAGTYTLTVTDDFDCSQEATITISESSSLVVNLSLSHGVSCSGGHDGSVASNVTGGNSPYAYAWSSGQTTADITSLTAGTYTLTVTDDTDCSTVESITVTQPGALLVEIAIDQTISCYGGSNGSVVTYAGDSGTPPYSYAWSNGQNSATLTDLSVGTYSLTVTDANDCTFTNEITLNQPDELILSLNSTAVTGNGTDDGTATATISGGMPDYTYHWSNGGTTAIVSGLAAGDYYVTVTDANDCTQTGTVTVNSYDCDLTATIEVTNASCPEGEDGSALVVTANGEAPYSYHWSNGQVHNPAVILPAGVISCVVTDAAGCEVTVSATVSDADGESPVAHGNNVTIYLDADGHASTSVEDVNAGSTDNCGIASMVLSQSDFDCADIGINQIVLTVTDNSGNSDTEDITVTVVDNLPPTIIAADLTIALDSNGEMNITPAQVDDGSYDNCGIASMALSQTTFTCDDLGENEVSFTITTTSGETASYTVSVFVTDTTLPTLFVNDVTLALDGNGVAVLTAEQGSITGADNCGTPAIAFSQTDFDCSDIGENEIVINATDASGLTVTQTIIVTIIDVTPPSVHILGDTIIYLNDDNVATISPEVVNISSSDNCDIVSMTLSQASFTCDDIGENQVIFRATDEMGNYSEGIVFVTVVDSVAPEVTCPSDLIISSCEPVEVTFDEPVYTDNCGVESAGFTQGMESGSLFPVGMTEQVFTVSDESGNTTACEFLVTVGGAGEIIIVVDSVVDASSSTSTDGAIYLSIFGGDGNYSFEWTDETGTVISSEEDLIGILPGIYDLTVVDGAGCVTMHSSIDVGYVVAINDIEDVDIQLYPNPTRNMLILKMALTNEESVVVRMMDVTGRQFIETKRETISQKTYSFELEKYPKGVYFVQIRIGEKVLTKRIVLF